MCFEWFRRHKISLGAVLGLSLLAGVVVVALPEVARRWALGELERALVPPVSIEDIDFNPFTGRATISNFVIGSTGTRRILYLPSVEVHLSPLSFFRGNLTVQSLRFVRPEMYLERTGPARFNVMELLQQPGQRRKAEERPFGVTIESVMIEQAKIGFVDDMRSPSFTRTLENVTLKTSRISTLPDLILTPTSFEMRLYVGEGSVAISGKATPLARPAGIELTSQWENLDPGIIQTYLPYATKYIRYEIKRGRVMTDVQYTYHAGDLSGENKIAIRQLQLGNRLGDEFEERIGVPLTLAVALLQDADGQIRLTVPVSGNFRDPQFDFGSLFWNALQNAIVRFLSAPLRLIGNIVTFGGRITQIRIEPVHCEPGSTELTDQGKQQLKQLAELMKSKPKVELEIHGFAGAHDIETLKKQRFREAVKAEGGNYETAVARLYRRSRGLGIFARLPSLKEMENYLTGITVVPQESLDALAKSRVQVIEKSLTALGVDSGRLWLGKHNANPNDEAPGRVEFSLVG